MKWRKTIKLISQAKTIAVASHVNPDGDTIGSMLALGIGLEQLNKKVYLLSADGVPKRYKNLPGADKVISSLSEKVDLAIAVDCGTSKLLGKVINVFDRADKIISFDHHEFSLAYADVEIIDVSAAAVGEIVYQALNHLKVTITQDVAKNILTSIIVETNSFRLPHVRIKTFQICAQLLKTGVDFYHLTEMVYWSKTKQSLVLSGICLSRCQFLVNGELVWSIIRKKDFDAVSGKDEDVDPVADEMRAMKGVRISVLFREKSNGYLRVSLRSKGHVNVAKLAEEYDGGGHFDVAGCFVSNNQGSIEEFLQKAKRLLKGKR